MELTLVMICALWLAFANLVALVLFWWDKRRARSKGWRVPERSLLSVALIGGSPAALLARRWFRHKTRKQPFVARLYSIILLQIGLFAGSAWLILTRENLLQNLLEL